MIKFYNLITFCICILFSSTVLANLRFGDNTLNSQQFLEFDGPMVCEYDSVNPFLQYRMDVIFYNSQDTLIIPGYFAADGNAANTSAKCGSRWRVNYNLPVGVWNYEVLFSQGHHVAITTHSEDTLYPHGEVGSVTAEWYLKLNNVGTRYRQWSTGEWFLKFGTDSPETSFAYIDFDGTYHQGTGGSQGLLNYNSHIQDWSTGNPTWQGDKGKGMMGALNYLSAQGQNSFSCVIMNINGDGRNCWPFVSHDTLNRIDVSKLTQWQIVLNHAGNLGIHWMVKLGEMENHTLLNSTNWRVMYRELIARFGHLPAVTWNLGEEYVYQDFIQQGVIKAAYIRDIDPYNHIVVFHNLTVLAEIFNSTTVRTMLDGASLQIGELIWTDSVVNLVRSYMNDTVFIITSDEQGPANHGVPSDTDNLSQTQDQVRQLNQYPALLGGCEGWEAYYGYHSDCTDLNCDDFRSRSNVWRTNRGIEEVFRQVEFWRGHPCGVNCFTTGTEWILYSTGDDVELVLSGSHTIQYFDVIDQIWELEEIYTGVASYDSEFAAIIREQEVLDLCESKLQFLRGPCYLILDWYGDKLEKYVNNEWIPISTNIDYDPSYYYRLTCNDIQTLYTAPEIKKCEYIVTPTGIKIISAGTYLIYSVDGRMITRSYLNPGIDITLPTGIWVVINGKPSVVIITNVSE